MEQVPAEEYRPRRCVTRVFVFTAAVVWAVAIAAGLWILWGYENTHGIAAEPPRQWPAESGIQRARGQATLVMLAHPHCPCTRAGIGELAAIMAHSQGRLTAYVLFLKPAGFADHWGSTDLWKSAERIPGLKDIVDKDGTEAWRCHAVTS